MDCNKLAAAEVHEDSDRLKAEVDCCSLPAAEVEATTDWRQQRIVADWQQQLRWRRVSQQTGGSSGCSRLAVAEVDAAAMEVDAATDWREQWL